MADQHEAPAVVVLFHVFLKRREHAHVRDFLGFRRHLSGRGDGEQRQLRVDGCVDLAGLGEPRRLVDGDLSVFRVNFQIRIWRAELAVHRGVDIKTVDRWVAGGLSLFDGAAAVAELDRCFLAAFAWIVRKSGLAKPRSFRRCRRRRQPRRDERARDESNRHTCTQADRLSRTQPQSVMHRRSLSIP